MLTLLTLNYGSVSAGPIRLDCWRSWVRQCCAVQDHGWHKLGRLMFSLCTQYMADSQPRCARQSTPVQGELGVCAYMQDRHTYGIPHFVLTI